MLQTVYLAIHFVPLHCFSLDLGFCISLDFAWKKSRIKRKKCDGIYWWLIPTFLGKKKSLVSISIASNRNIAPIHERCGPLTGKYQLVSVRKLCLLGWKKSAVILPCSFTAFRVNFQRSPIWALNLYFEKSKTTAVFKN